MSEFLQRAESEIQNRQLFSRGQKILVAVSGGADSMVLLHVLHSLAQKNRWQISVAHFNHRLRGRASDADEKFIRQTAKKLRVAFFSENADVKKFAAQSKLSIEMAARKLRHEFFARAAKTEKIPTVALAHHADDQVELFFLRLFRGAGGAGLAGMKNVSFSPATKNVSLARPFLNFSKLEILDFARENKILFRADATNFENDFLRNRIRNELLPLLQKNYQSQIANSILRAMEIVGAESRFVAAAAANIRSGKSKLKNPFATMPLAIQRGILKQELIAAQLLPEFELIEQLRIAPKKFVSVNAGFSVARDLDGNILLRENLKNDFRPDEMKIKLPGRVGRTDFGGKKFRWQKISAKSKIQNPKSKIGREFFDADKIGAEIILRHWRAGDRFQPIGMKSAVRLQDFFVNAKIPREQRRNLVLATTLGGEIFWIENLRIGEKFKLTAQTQRKLIWNWSKIDG